MRQRNSGVFIIAEAGINHNGDLALAKQMVDAAKEAGVDCIKFQTFNVDELFDQKDRQLTYTYRSQGKEITESQYEMFKRCQFSKTAWREIIAYCRKRKVVFATTPQNPTDLKLILSLTDLPFLKVGADDLTNLPLLRQYAKQNKPMIISAGMAYGSEIAEAVEMIRLINSTVDLTVLHCVSSYPTEPIEVNLSKIPLIRDAFGVKIGFSDHTIGNAAAIGAVCFGAQVIEKHFTLDHNLPGPDHWFSIEARELKTYAHDIRNTEKMIGKPVLVPTAKELAIRKICRRSAVAKEKIAKGELFTENKIEFKRTSQPGLSPRLIDALIGQAAKRNYHPGELIN
jgi:sialic acid synthase SpsE